MNFRRRLILTAGVIAAQKGTAEAVEWANGLSTEAEKDAAHATIAKSAPQGIGAALASTTGLPK